MKISIVICTYNREDYIVDCLNHAAQQSVGPEKYEVLIVDNNSTDNTTHLIKEALLDASKFSNFSYFFEEKQGLSYARNRGIDESNGDIITFIDDDAFVSTTFVEEVIKAFSSPFEPDAIGGKIIPRYESNEPAWMSTYLIPLVSALDMGNRPKPFPGTKYPIGANMSFKADIFTPDIRFDVDLGRKGKGFQGSEEKDLFIKIKKSGRKIFYFPGPLVEHIVPDKRIQPDFIRNLARGIGNSEKVRSRKGGNHEFARLLLREAWKWAGTLALAFVYGLGLQFQKAGMLLRFRYWVSKGIIKR